LLGSVLIVFKIYIMDWIILIIIFCLAAFGMHKWVKVRDIDYLWLSILNTIGLLIKALDIVIEKYLNLEATTQDKLDVYVHYFWLVFLIFLAIIITKNMKKMRK